MKLKRYIIVYRCEAFAKSIRKRLIQHPKFFFFDIGVLNGLMSNFEASPDRMGALFEHFIFNQLVSTAFSYNETIRISCYRTANGIEVDFILEQKNKITAIEVKASKIISSSDLRGLKDFKNYYGKTVRLIVLYLGESSKIIDGVEILPWQTFFQNWV